MASVFDVTEHYRGPDGLESYSPFWIVAVVRFRNPLTYNRKNRDSNLLGMTEREPVIIQHECIQLSVTSSKGSHVSNLNATIEAGSREWVSEVMPGDWLFAWMLRDHHEGKRVLQLVESKQAANGFNDGLKFVGRVQGMRKSVRINPHDGKKNITFIMNGVGFSEFDYSVFYEPLLLKQQINIAQLDELGVFMQSVVVQENKDVMDQGLIDINKMLPALTRLFLGAGAYSRTPSATDAHGKELKPAPAGAPRVPPTAAAWLGAPGAKTYSDILDIVMGIQAYNSVGDITNSPTPWEHFLPAPLIKDDFGAYKTGNPLRGQFSVDIPPIMNQPFWSVLGNFLNHPINEMNVALRANLQGKVVPMLTVRQIPFSSQFGLPTSEETKRWTAPDFSPSATSFGPNDLLTKPDVTKFLSLPRWKLTGIWSADVGRSDALRTNYVHISGIPGVGTAVDEINMFVQCPPLRDDEDIGRSGLRPYQAQVNCTFKDTVAGPSRWRDIMTDILMGQHLTLTGTIYTPGIDLPIAPGDNLEFEDVAYHIETVSHSAGIGGDGSKYYQSVLQLSNGVTTKQVNEYDDDVAQYAGIDEQDPVTVRARNTAEVE